MPYNWEALPRPFYLSKRGSSFQQWLCTLTGYIGAQLAENKRTNSSRVFEACRGVLKNDSQMALYLLPHAVVQALLEEYL